MTATPTTLPVDTAVAVPRPGATGRLLRNPIAVAAGAVLLTVVLVSVFAPLLAPFDPNTVVPGLARAAPGGEHLMGGDGAGRDVFSRLLHGGRMTLLGALVTALVAMGIGIPAGLAAGYYGGRLDTVTGWVADMLLAIPNLVILLAIIAAIGPQTVPVMAMFGVLLSPAFFRLVRTAVRGVRNELYVDAARISGLTDGRIIRSHILAVVRAPIVIQTSIAAGVSVLVQSGLQFLALGDTAVPSWGQMLGDAFANIYSAPYLVLWPGITIGLTVAALALLGGALRDALVDRPAAPRARAVAAAPVADPPAVASAATAGGQGLLVIDGLTITYPRADGGEHTVVNAVSLAIERGEVLGLVGESGSGKSQTAFAVLGLLPASARVTAGTIAVDGTPLSGDPRTAARMRGRRIGYIPQEPMSNLDPSFTVGSQLVEPMRVVLGLSRSAARTRALDLLDRVGIPDPPRTFAAYPHQISGGMAQRVLIAGAVSCDPELLIADEPTTALDVTVQAEVLDVLRGLQRERRMAMLMVTHNLGVVADICDRVAVMQHGEIVEQNDVRSIFSGPRHPYTRMLLGSTLEGASLRAPLGVSAGLPERTSS